MLNSIAISIGASRRSFALIKAPLIEASTWGLLIAISALGLGTSLPAIAALGWRHVATVTGTTVVILGRDAQALPRPATKRAQMTRLLQCARYSI